MASRLTIRISGLGQEQLKRLIKNEFDKNSVNLSAAAMVHVLIHRATRDLNNEKENLVKQDR